VIGYYVHHHGSGHRHRALAIASHLGDGVTLLGSLGPASELPTRYVELPRDDDPEPGDDADVTAGGALHWAPLRHSGQQARAEALASWLVHDRASALVCDVSVEAALLARLMSVPPVVVALRGDRLDRAHAAGYDCAVRILAPWMYGAILAVFASTILWASVVVGRRVGLLGPPPASRHVPAWRDGAAGILSLTAYLLILFAYSIAPLAAVAPLRESGIVLAAAWGALRLGESVAGRDAVIRIVAAALVVLGAVLLAVAPH